jgi:hypothetical protein
VAGLVLLLGVAGGAVVQWSTPGVRTSTTDASGTGADGGSTALDQSDQAATGDGDADATGSAPGPDNALAPSEPGRDRPLDTDAVGMAPDVAGPTPDAAGNNAAGNDAAENDAAGSDADTMVIDATTGRPVDDDTLSAPWWRRALPVEGRIVPVEGDASGAVRIDVVGTQAVQVTLTGILVSDLPRTRSVRIGLSAGDVIGEQRAERVGDDVPVDIGSFTPDGEHPVLVVVDPQVLPAVVHSVLLLDSESGRVLGGAEMLPAR